MGAGEAVSTEAACPTKLKGFTMGPLTEQLVDPWAASWASQEVPWAVPLTTWP